MPEGPEVKITADGLAGVLVGKYITNISVNNASRYFNSGLTNHSSICLPLNVYEVSTKGKKILIKGVDANGNYITMISALGMEGSWKLHSGKHAGIELSVYNHDDTSVYQVYFHDTRHFGTFNICMSQSEIDFVLKDVGPDLLSEDVPYDLYHSVITSHKLRNKEICWFMMEQKYFSGVGNYLLAEILYACRILPTRLLKDLSTDDIYNLWYYSRQLIAESYNSRGLTIATYFDINGGSGTFNVKIYGCKTDPYGNSVVTGTFSNKRTSHYVPAVQC